MHLLFDLDEDFPEKALEDVKGLFAINKTVPTSWSTSSSWPRHN